MTATDLLAGYGRFHPRDQLRRRWFVEEFPRELPILMIRAFVGKVITV